MNTYRWSFQSVRYLLLHARTTSTQLATRNHSAIPSTVPLATPTQSADSGRIGTEVSISRSCTSGWRLKLKIQ